MAQRRPAVLPVENADDPFWALYESFERSMRAAGKSPTTITTYRRVAVAAHRYLRDHQAPLDPAQLRRQHLEAFLNYLREERQQGQATIHLSHMALRSFFKWLVAEGELDESPMARMTPGKVDLPAPQVLTDEQLEALLHTCDRAATSPYETFLNRRDAALMRFFLDTGLRRAEVLSIRLEDLDLREQMVQIVRKGGRRGVAFYGARTARDLDRYLRVRAKQSMASSPYLWLPGSRGGMVLGHDGLRTMLLRRAQLAGIDRIVNPHAFRHAFADRMKAAGASDEDVMTLGGWSDPTVMRRYGAARATERAREAHRRHSPGDRV